MCYNDGFMLGPTLIYSPKPRIIICPLTIFHPHPQVNKSWINGMRRSLTMITRGRATSWKLVRFGFENWLTSIGKRPQRDDVPFERRIPPLECKRWFSVRPSLDFSIHLSVHFIPKGQDFQGLSGLESRQTQLCHDPRPRSLGSTTTATTTPSTTTTTTTTTTKETTN